MNLNDFAKVFTLCAAGAMAGCQSMPQQEVSHGPAYTGGGPGANPYQQQYQPPQPTVGQALQNGAAEIGQAFRQMIDPRQYIQTTQDAVQFNANRRWNETGVTSGINARARIQRELSNGIDGVRDRVHGNHLGR